MTPPADPPPSPPPAEAALLDLEERRLRNDKLRAEIARDRLAWWKQPGYLAAAVPILIAGFGLLAAWGTGFFDRERAQLRAEQQQLRADVLALTQTRDTLAARAEALDRQVRDATAARDRLEAEARAARRQTDAAYVRLRGAVAAAEYALGHVTSWPDLSREDKARVQAAVAGLPK